MGWQQLLILLVSVSLIHGRVIPIQGTTCLGSQDDKYRSLPETYCPLDNVAQTPDRHIIDRAYSDIQCDPYSRSYYEGLPGCPDGHYCHLLGACQPLRRPLSKSKLQTSSQMKRRQENVPYTMKRSLPCLAYQTFYGCRRDQWCQAVPPGWHPLEVKAVCRDRCYTTKNELFWPCPSGSSCVTRDVCEVQCNGGIPGYAVKCTQDHDCRPRGVCEVLKTSPTISVGRRSWKEPDHPEKDSQTWLEGPRLDGRCGRNYQGASCDGSEYGPCCSRLGWCGRSVAHCFLENECQSGCSDNPQPIDRHAVVAIAGRDAATPPPASSAPGIRVTSAEEPTIRPTSPTTLIPAPGPSPAPQHPSPGVFNIRGRSGVPAMHAALLQNGQVIFLDKVENYTEVRFSNGNLAYSTEYDPAGGHLSALSYETNAFCSGGAFLTDGRLVSIGGNGPLILLDPTVSDGFDGIRYLERSVINRTLDGTPWSEPGNKLASKRWYASVQILPDGSIFVASGSLNGLDPLKTENNNPTFEILDSKGISSGRNVEMDILVKNQPYYMYPFLHLLSDGNLFVFTSRSSQILTISGTASTKELPNMPGMYRTYPNTGGSVLLPLTNRTNYEPEIMICGGGAYSDLPSPTDASCGRIKPLTGVPQWEMDAMPEGRCMVEGTLLPDGTILWLNGARKGSQGFGLADDPALDALIYDPEKELGKRWSVAGTSTIPRLYHSVALILLDGTVLIAGSGPNEMPVLPQQTNPDIPARKYATEFRVEIYTPPYLVGENASKRPQQVSISTTNLRPDGSTFQIRFRAPEGAREVKVVLYHGGFVTHSLHMGQRMVVLDQNGWESGGGEKQLEVRMPEKQWGHNVLPPGPYILFVVVDGVPSVGQFVTVG